MERTLATEEHIADVSRRYLLRGQKEMKIAEESLQRLTIANGFVLKLREASWYFFSAAEAFRAASSWMLAATALKRASEVQEQLGSILNAALYSSDAAKCMAKVNVPASIVEYKRCASLYCDCNQYEAAARIHERVGRILEKRKQNEEAVVAYRTSAELFYGQLRKQEGDIQIERAAFLAGEGGDYETAATLFEHLARSYVSSNLRRFSAKRHLFHALLCLMAMKKYRVCALKLSLHYPNIDPTFAPSSFALFVRDLLIALKEGDLFFFIDTILHMELNEPMDAWVFSFLELFHSYTKRTFARKERERERILLKKQAQERRVEELKRKKRGLDVEEEGKKKAGEEEVDAVAATMWFDLEGISDSEEEEEEQEEKEGDSSQVESSESKEQAKEVEENREGKEREQSKESISD